MELTSKQQEILAELGAGLSPSEISYSLSISRTSLQYHIQRIRESYGTWTYQEAIQKATERGDL